MLFLLYIFFTFINYIIHYESCFGRRFFGVKIHAFVQGLIRLYKKYLMTRYFFNDKKRLELVSSDDIVHDSD